MELGKKMDLGKKNGIRNKKMELVKIKCISREKKIDRYEL